MQRHTQQLRQLLLDSQYAVDPAAVAEAILTRARTRRTVIGAAFRNDPRVPGDLGTPDEPQVRSFRPTRQARSFRPCNGKGVLPAIGEDQWDRTRR